MTEKVEISMLECLAMLNNGYSFADMQGITPEQMETVYALAYQYYNAQNYEQAVKLFNGLCLFDPSEQKYFTGLAACEQALKNYEHAANLYSVSAVLSGLKDPEPMYYAAVCLLKAGRRDDAITTLKSLSEMGREGKDKEHDQSFMQKGQELLKVLQQTAE